MSTAAASVPAVRQNQDGARGYPETEGRTRRRPSVASICRAAHSSRRVRQSGRWRPAAPHPPTPAGRRQTAAWSGPAALTRTARAAGLRLARCSRPFCCHSLRCYSWAPVPASRAATSVAVRPCGRPRTAVRRLSSNQQRRALSQPTTVFSPPHKNDAGPITHQPKAGGEARHGRPGRRSRSQATDTLVLLPGTAQRQLTPRQSSRPQMTPCQTSGRRYQPEFNYHGVHGNSSPNILNFDGTGKTTDP